MSATQTGSAYLRAGAGMTDITPEMGIQLAGDIGRYRPTEEIRERLYARALVLEAEGRRCCLLSLDLLAASNQWSDEIRRRLAERFEMDPGAVVVHVTQNHAAPNLGNTFVREECELMPSEYPWLRGGDERYNEPTVKRITNAVQQAVGSLRPARVRVGRGMNGRVAFNRRFVMRDGSAQTHPPLCDPKILHVEGPTDPEVGVMTVEEQDGAPIALLLHHTCHPTHGYAHRYVISDWPGIWAELMAERVGGGCVPLVLNGCCGNVHHTDHLDPHYRHDHVRAAELLTETAGGVLERLEPVDPAPLRWRRSQLRLPLRELDAEEIKAAEELVRRHPDPIWIDEEKTRVEWDWVYAVALLDLKARREEDPFCDYEVQAFRIGQIALVTLMGEPFVEVQLRIKLQSPAPQTFVAHFCNGYAGYIPTREALRRGGYETRTSNWSKFAPEALELIGDGAVGLLGELFPNEGT